MRYTQRFESECIHQWKSCYLNYKHLKTLVKILRDSVRERIQLQNIMNYGTHIQARTQKTISLKLIQAPNVSQQVQQYHEYFVNSSNEINQQFQQAYSQNIQLYKSFILWKFKEIKANFHTCWKAHFLMQTQDNKIQKQFINYVQYVFVQAFYLSRMVQTNIQAQRRILDKFKLYSTNVFKTPQDQIQKILNIDECHFLRRQIQRFYFRISKQNKKKNRYKLRKLAEQGYIKPRESLLIGILLGSVVSVIIFMSIILSRSSVTLQTNTIFNKDFTLWRGIGIFIFYIWVLGVDFAYFQKYKISHRIIFKNNYPEYPKSTDLFKIAGVFSIIFVIVFTIYSLQIAGLLEVGTLYPQWLPLFVWGPFLIFLFNPLPILYPYGRLFFFKLILNAIASVIIVVDFPKIFVTAQAISLVNVFQDLFYAICFYTNLQLPEDPNTNTCKTPSIQAKFIYTVVIYSIRIIQCLKVGFGQGSYWKKSQFLNSIKFSIALLTAILAYVWSQTSKSQIFPVWIVFAVINTLFSWTWDTKIGWDLLQKNNENYCLRKQLIYPKRNYYIWVFINLLLRSAWTLNISTAVVRQFIGSPEVFNLALGFLQVGRRGMWNLLRLQVEQIRNNSMLQALSKQKDKLQKKIDTFVQSKKQVMGQFSTETLIQSQKIMMAIDKQTKEQIQKQKQVVIQKVEKFKDFYKQQKIRAQTIQQTNQQNIKQLLKDVY